MKKYFKPDIIEENIELDDIIAKSNVGNNVKDIYDDNEDQTPFPWWFIWKKLNLFCYLI